jgi:hypothetical protein
MTHAGDPAANTGSGGGGGGSNDAQSKVYGSSALNEKEKNKCNLVILF